MEVKSAVTGKDWVSGRELGTGERALRGAFGVFDLVPGVGSITKFSGSARMLNLGKNMGTLGLKSGIKAGIRQEVTHIGDMVKEAGQISATRLKSAKAAIKDGSNVMLNKAAKGTIQAGSAVDTGITFGKNLNPSRKRLVVATTGEKVYMPAENTHAVENKLIEKSSKIKGINLDGPTPKEVGKTEKILDTKIEKYVRNAFEGTGREAQNNFNKYLRENVWCDETLSNFEKVEIMKANFDKLTPEQKVNFNVINDARVIKNPDYSDWGEWPAVDWPEFPGLNKDTAKSVYNEATGKIEIPKDLDRIGSPYGNNLGVVENGYHSTQGERSICYIENEYAKNSYKFDGSLYKDAIDAIKDFDIG